MTMADVARSLNEKRPKTKRGKNMAYERWARQIHNDLIGSTLFRACKGEEISVDTLQKLGPWAVKNGYHDLLAAMASYVFGVDDLAVMKKPTSNSN